jgi:hypothetical protein
VTQCLLWTRTEFLYIILMNFRLRMVNIIRFVLLLRKTLIDFGLTALTSFPWILHTTRIQHVNNNNSIQFNSCLFTCKLNSSDANYKVSTRT